MADSNSNSSSNNGNSQSQNTPPPQPRTLPENPYRPLVGSSTGRKGGGEGNTAQSFGKPAIKIVKPE